MASQHFSREHTRGGATFTVAQTPHQHSPANSQCSGVDVVDVVAIVAVVVVATVRTSIKEVDELKVGGALYAQHRRSVRPHIGRVVACVWKCIGTTSHPKETNVIRIRHPKDGHAAFHFQPENINAGRI